MKKGICEECGKEVVIKEVDWLSIEEDGKVRYFCNVRCATEWQDKRDDLG